MSNTSIPKIFMAGGALGFTYYLFMRPYWFPNPYKTQGMKNIEDAHTRGGAMPNHTPGTATPTGDATNTSTVHTTPYKGPDGEHHERNINDQKSEPGVWPEKFYKGQYDNPKGK